jgi:hypothetical protein
MTYPSGLNRDEAATVAREFGVALEQIHWPSAADRTADRPLGLVGSPTLTNGVERSG